MERSAPGSSFSLPATYGTRNFLTSVNTPGPAFSCICILGLTTNKMKSVDLELSSQMIEDARESYLFTLEVILSRYET